MKLLLSLFVTGCFFSSMGTLSCSRKILPAEQRIYDPNVYKQLWSVDWNSDEKYIASGGVDSVLRIYHASNLKLYRSFDLESWIHVVKWHPNKNLLAVATLDRYVLLVNLDNGLIAKLERTGGSRAIDWNSTGDMLVVGELEGQISLWNAAGKLVKDYQLEYSADAYGKSFLGIDWHPFKNEFVATNFQINIFDASGNNLHSLQHPNKAAIMLCVQWHPSGEYFVIGDYGHNWEGENVPSLLHFWNADGDYLRAVEGSKSEYRNLAWSQDGSMLATASDVLRLWDRNGKLLYESQPDGINYLWGIDWNTKGRKIVTSSRFQSVALWDSNARLIKSIKN